MPGHGWQSEHKYRETHQALPLPAGHPDVGAPTESNAPSSRDYMPQRRALGARSDASRAEVGVRSGTYRLPMLLVIFGAGASYDSAALSPAAEIAGATRPPLAKDLLAPKFDELTDRLPEARPIIDLLRDRTSSAGAQPMEEALANLVGQAGASPIRQKQLIAFRFHLLRLIRGTAQKWFEQHHGFTHYVRLLNHLLNWQESARQRVLLATFNYDALLDMAAQDVLGWRPLDLNSYISRDDFRIFKLHGSTEWSRVFDLGRLHQTRDTAELAMENPSLLAHASIELGAPGLQVQLDGRLRFPSMAIPMAGKTGFECRQHT